MKLKNNLKICNGCTHYFDSIFMCLIKKYIHLDTTKCPCLKCIIKSNCTEKCGERFASFNSYRKFLEE